MPSRARLIAAAQRRVRTIGFHGTSIKDVLADSEASSASLYHHFPGGKDQLVAEAVRDASVDADEALRALVAGGAPAATVHTYFDAAARALAESDYRDGCPVGTPGADASGATETVRVEVEAGLRRWRDTIAEALRDNGAPPDRSTALANTVLAAYEGAILLAKAQRSTSVLSDVAGVLSDLLTQATGPSTHG
jgi:TetR/AcrR family transcriptional repressor of lmrAB and yxaGH operons